VKSAPPPDRVPFRAILALSFGSLGSCYVLFSINNLAFPIYNLALGVSAVKLGWAMALPRVIDAFFDPLIGWLSDNTRSRWGRRKPYIVAGAFPLALFTVLLWLPPSKAGPDVIFWYFLVISIFYYLAYSVCVVPLSALGFELSNDYNERTRIMGWGSIIALLGGLSTPWLYKLTLLPVFGGDEVAGVRWIGGMLAVVIFFTTIAPGIYCRERFPDAARRKVGLLESVGLTLANGPFRLVTAGTLVAAVVTCMVGPCLLYVNIYEICGSKAFAAKVIALAGTTQMVAAFLGVPVNTWLAKRIGKRPTALACAAITAAGFALYAVTLTPAHPYWQLGSNFVVGWGIQGVWIMCAAMMADVCDDDEMKTGHRREAFYGAAMSFTNKAALALSAAAGGYLVYLAGYRENAAPSHAVMAHMRSLFIWCQVAGMAGCGVILWFYPLTRARMGEIRAALDARHGKEPG